MNIMFNYFWPIFAAGLIAGMIGGVFAFRRKTRRVMPRGIGLLLALLFAILWNGPLGAGDRLAVHIERNVHATLVYYELPQVSAHLHRGPLSRHVDLSGPNTDFQRYELPRTMETLPGVSGASWSNDVGIPLILEASGMALLGFLFGLGLAYLIELHRRYNAQWNW